MAGNENSGGARVGAGRKKKSLNQKIIEGNSGKRPLAVMEFTDTANLTGVTMPEPNKILKAMQKNGKELQATAVYQNTWQWLSERG